MIQTGTPILRDAELLQLGQDNGGMLTAALIQQATGMSQSNANYRLRQLRAKGIIDAFGMIQTPAPSASTPAAAPVVQIAPETQALHARAAAIGAPVLTISAETPAPQAPDAPALSLDLSHLIPAERTDYIRRPIDDRLEALANRRENVLLIGEASAGKTTAAEQLAARRGVPFLRIACDDSAVLKDYIGRRELVNGQTVFKAGLFLSLIKTPCVILLDEFNALPPSRLFFLHELLDNRRFFVREAAQGEIIDCHPEAVIMLACNPAGARYAGTNKMNAALIDRCAVVDVPTWTPEQVAHLFDTGRPETTAKLIKYYTDARAMISQQSLRAVFSLRAVKRVAASLRAGDSAGVALSTGFFNAALLTAGTEERDALAQLARVVFGVTDRDTLAQSDFGGGR